MARADAAAQRGLDVLATMSTVTTAGIGVITCRASCSCRWKTPREHPALAGVRAPPVEDSAISRLSSSGPASSSAICSGRTPSSRRIAFEVALSATMKGAEADREPVQGPRDDQDRPLGVDDRHDLRHLLAQGDVQRRGHDVGEDHRHDDGDAVGQEAAERRLEQLGDRRLAQEADAQRGQRDAELASRQVLAEVVEQQERGAHGLVRLLALQLLQPAAARAHERELGRDEEPVEQDQDEDGQQEQDAHPSGSVRSQASREPLLRGGSASLTDAGQSIAGSAPSDAGSGGADGACGADAATVPPAGSRARRRSPAARRAGARPGAREARGRRRGRPAPRHSARTAEIVSEGLTPSEVGMIESRCSTGPRTRRRRRWNRRRRGRRSRPCGSRRAGGPRRRRGSRSGP